MKNNQLISIFSFGIVLVIVGAIGKLLKWQQANIILALGMVFELLAVLIYAYKKIRK
jgi:hypothetical protein